MPVVYWIRLESHTDILTQGYVGVAKDFNKRMKKHCTATPKLDNHFSRAIVKYGWENLIKTIVFTGSESDCYCKEKELRKDFQIGWNEAIGGCGGDRSLFIDYKSRINQGWNYDKSGTKNPFYGKTHSKEMKVILGKAHSTSIIYTDKGVFYGFRALGRYLNVHKLTAKKIAIAKGWKIESKRKGAIPH